MKLLAIVITIINIIMAIIYIWFGNSKDCKGNQYNFFYSLALLNVVNVILIWWF